MSIGAVTVRRGLSFMQMGTSPLQSRVNLCAHIPARSFASSKEPGGLPSRFLSRPTRSAFILDLPSKERKALMETHGQLAAVFFYCRRHDEARLHRQMVKALNDRSGYEPRTERDCAKLLGRIRTGPCFNADEYSQVLSLFRLGISHSLGNSKLVAILHAQMNLARP